MPYSTVEPGSAIRGAVNDLASPAMTFGTPVATSQASRSALKNQ